MPIDASIALGVRPPQIESPMNALAKVLQVQEAQQSRQMGQMKMDEYTRGQEEARTMNQLYQSALNPDGTIDRNKLYSGAAARGLGAKIPALQEKFLALDKTGGEIAHKKGETTKNAVATAEKKVAFFKEQMFNVNDPQTAAQLITAMHSDPDLQPLGMDKVPLDKMLAQIPQDPAQFGEFKAKYALGADKFMADLRAKAQQAETGRHNLATEGLTASGQKITMRGQDISASTTRRGQDMVDARTRETTSASMTKPFEVTAPDGVTKILVQQDKAGNIRPVEGYLPKGGATGDPKLTEVQSNATAFVSRMRDSSATLNSLEKDVGRLDTEAAKSTFTNWLASPKAQQYQQARRNWVTANLRKESGAAIPPDELESEYKKWFPVVGDSKAVIAQKQQSRKVAEEAMLVQAGPGGRQVGGILERGGSPAVKGQATSNIESLLDKYK